MEIKLYRLSEITEGAQKCTSEECCNNELGKPADGHTMRVLMQARHCWDNMSKFRRERDRTKRYYHGDQWSDIVTVDGEDMTEEEYIRRQGSVPLKNNLIRRLGRAVVGVYASQNKEPVCYARDTEESQLGKTMSTVLQCNWQRNEMSQLNIRLFEEYLISGAAIVKKTYGWRGGKLDCWTDIVPPNNFFIDADNNDVRGWSCHMCGEIKDYSFEALCREYAKKPGDVKRLRDMYGNAANRDLLFRNCEEFGYSRLSNVDFLMPRLNGMCRVIEVWNHEQKERYHVYDPATGELFKIELSDYNVAVTMENARRMAEAEAQGIPSEEVPLRVAEWFVDDLWYFRNLTPFGQVLSEGETPYVHGEHPYVYRFYPYLDGEIHSFIGDFIDQQRYVNRLVTLQDWMLKSTAKGVLLFPEDCLPKGMSLQDVAEQWSRFDGVIPINAKQGVALPQQVNNSSSNVSISEQLQMQLKFFEDISGVHGAMQGKSGYSGTSASLYAQQAQNSSMTLLDLLDSFSAFVVASAYKDVKNIQQYYDAPRTMKIAGALGEVVWNPADIADVDFDLSIAEATSTPLHKMMANDFLMQLLQSGAITVDQALEVGSFPFGEELLQSIKAKQEEAQQQQQQQAAMQQQMAEQEQPQEGGEEYA